MTTETTTIKTIKAWQDNMKREWRVYATTSDGREGCWYLTGNSFNKASTNTGNLTAEEWTQVNNIRKETGTWNYSSTPRYTKNYNKCPDCGSYTCGPNCDSNRSI